MRVSWHTDYRPDPSLGRIPPPSWPADWPLPRVGETIVNELGDTLEVTAIEWYPHGDGDPNDPFVYIVTHPPGFGR